MDKYINKYVKTAIFTALMTICSAFILIAAILTSDSGFSSTKHTFTLVITLCFALWFAVELYQVYRYKTAAKSLILAKATYTNYVSKTFGLYRTFRVFSVYVEITEENGEKLKMSTPYEFRQNQIKDLVVGSEISVSYNKKLDILIINMEFAPPDTAETEQN